MVAGVVLSLARGHTIGEASGSASRPGRPRHESRNQLCRVEDVERLYAEAGVAPSTRRSRQDIGFLQDADEQMASTTGRAPIFRSYISRAASGSTSDARDADHPAATTCPGPPIPSRTREGSPAHPAPTARTLGGGRRALTMPTSQPPRSTTGRCRTFRRRMRVAASLRRASGPTEKTRRFIHSRTDDPWLSGIAFSSCRQRGSGAAGPGCRRAVARPRRLPLGGSDRLEAVDDRVGVQRDAIDAFSTRKRANSG